MRLTTYVLALSALLGLGLPSLASAQTYYYNPGSYYYPSSYQYQYSYPYQYQYGYYPYGNYGYNYYPRPTCSITYQYINNAYWDSRGLHQPIQLSWSANYASSAYISGIGTVYPTGQQVVYPSGNTTYTMTAYGPGGSYSCQVSYSQPNYNNYWGYQNQYYYNQYYPQYYSYPYNYQYGYPYYYGY